MVFVNEERTSVQNEARPATAGVLTIAAVVALLHLLTNSRYGLHRDELQFLSDALHLDWGFVPYPPFTPFVQHIALQIFGLNLVGLRLFSVLVQSIAIFVTGRIAWELGGGRMAQMAATVSAALGLLPLFEGTEFQYSSFDFLWWVLAAYFVVRLLKTENPRWWLAIGVTIGVGLLTKYTMVFYVAGILTGLLLTPARRSFRSRWFWCGVALAFLIFVPNLLWQVHHDFISYRFLHYIHARDVRNGRAEGFLSGQFWICTNLFSAPLWIAGLVGYFRDRRYRVLAWMYAIPFAIFFFNQGRHYYLAAAYPMLLAMGAVVAERWLATLSHTWRRTIESVYFTGVVVCGMLACALVVPLAGHGPLKDFALKNNGDLREEIGWNEMVQTVAGIRDSLPAEQRANVGVLVGNYGEQGAIEILGPAYHLPPPISTTNSAWLRGAPANPPTTLIVIGYSRELAEKTFTGCRLAGHTGNNEGVKNEESENHPDIFVCGPPRKSWAEFWNDEQRYG